MAIHVFWIGKPSDVYIQAGCDLYEGRIKQAHPFAITRIDPPKGPDVPSYIQGKDAEALLSKIETKHFLVLLDEAGKSNTSVQFARQLESWFVQGASNIAFVIGGAYGFHESVYARANAKVSLSALTMPHQLARLVFLEQLYRAFSILQNKKYHH